MNEEQIKVPVSWLKTLSRLSQDVSKQVEEGEDCDVMLSSVSKLAGFASSAETLVSLSKKKSI